MAPLSGFILSNSTVEDSYKLAARNGTRYLLVGNPEELRGTVDRVSIEAAIRSGKAADLVTSLLLRDPAHVHPDHALELAPEHLKQSAGLLPILSRSLTNRVVGTITAETLARALQRDPRVQLTRD
jgi:CBS domain-containing protein